MRRSSAEWSSSDRNEARFRTVAQFEHRRMPAQPPIETRGFAGVRRRDRVRRGRCCSCKCVPTAAPSGARRCRAMVIGEAATMSMTSDPSTRVTVACADANCGGTEY